jgi:hypothetical protein
LLAVVIDEPRKERVQHKLVKAQDKMLVEQGAGAHGNSSSSSSDTESSVAEGAEARSSDAVDAEFGEEPPRVMEREGNFRPTSDWPREKQKSSQIPSST